jgi:hypothetical protein
MPYGTVQFLGFAWRSSESTRAVFAPDRRNPRILFKKGEPYPIYGRLNRWPGSDGHIAIDGRLAHGDCRVAGATLDYSMSGVSGPQSTVDTSSNFFSRDHRTCHMHT